MNQPVISTADLKELKELLQFGFDIQKAVQQSLDNDGKIDFSDIPYWIGTIGSAGSAFNGLGNPIARYRNLSAEDKRQLWEWTKVNFKLGDTPTQLELEFLIESTLEQVVNIATLYHRWQSFLNRPTATA